MDYFMPQDIYKPSWDAQDWFPTDTPLPDNQWLVTENDAYMITEQNDFSASFICIN
jgi:hypothetical protein